VDAYAIFCGSEELAGDLALEVLLLFDPRLGMFWDVHKNPRSCMVMSMGVNGLIISYISSNHVVIMRQRDK
jgi:hypothetical protein